MIGVVKIKAELLLDSRNSSKARWVKANSVDGILFENVIDKVIEDVVLLEPGKNNANGIKREICNCQGRGIDCLEKTGHLSGFFLLKQEFKPNVGINQLHQLFHQLRDFF